MTKQLTLGDQGKEPVLKIPTITELIKEFEEPEQTAERTLVALLNTPPPDKWLKDHPNAKKKVNGQYVPCKYLPIDKVEYLLSRTFTRWWVEVIDTKVMANSCTVTVRLFVVNPITKDIMHNDGVGAVAIQTDSGAGAMDWNKVKSAGVQIALPAAKTYAVKDAAESFGRLFGKDINREGVEDYKDMITMRQDYTV